ncbi:MAG: hypothetical protein V3V05_04885 [Pontiella sp.]
MNKIIRILTVLALLIVAVLVGITFVNRPGDPLPKEYREEDALEDGGKVSTTHDTLPLLAQDKIEVLPSPELETSKPVVPENVVINEEERNVSEVIKMITSLNASYAERLEAMRNLSPNLSVEDVQALMPWLGEPNPDGLAISPIEYNSIKNDMMEILLQQEVMPEGIGQLLTGIYTSSEQDEIWRNYSIQFMTPFYERASAEYAGQGGAASDKGIASAAALKRVEQTLWNALDERGNSNAGTALLGLNYLSDKFPEFKKPDVQAAMVDLATDPSASEANRITALRLCGQQGHIEALNASRNVARNGNTTVLRCAAIATLGDLGIDEDRMLLETYADSSDLRIQRIARISLEKFSKD